MNFKVKHAMTNRVVTVHDSAMVDEVFELLLRHRISGMPVVDDNEHIVGVITEPTYLICSTTQGQGRARFLTT